MPHRWFRFFDGRENKVPHQNLGKEKQCGKNREKGVVKSPIEVGLWISVPLPRQRRGTETLCRFSGS